MKQPLIKFVSWAHGRVFRRDISPAMREFLSHAAWSFIGILVNASIFFLLNIVAGRILGPEGYGKYSLVATIMATVSLLMTVGFDITAVKYIAQLPREEDKNAVISNAVIVVLPLSLAVLGTLFLLREPLASALHTESRLVVLGLVFAFVYTCKNLLDGFVKALKLFPTQAAVKIAEAVVSLLAFALFFFVLHQRTYQAYIYSIGLGGGVAVLLFLRWILPRLRPWSPPVFAETRDYLKIFISFSVIGLMLNGIDKFFISHFMGAAALGLYSVYILSATVIVAQGILIVNNVFFPMVNQVDDKRQLLRSVDRLLIVGFLPIVVTAAVISYLVVLLFGRQYGVHWDLIALVSLISFAQIVSSLYGSIVGSSPELFRISTRIFAIKPLFVIIMYGGIYLLHLVSIPSVLTVLLLYYVFDAINTKVTFRLVPA